MKSFKTHLIEEKKYTEEEMIKWAEKNFFEYDTSDIVLDAARQKFSRFDEELYLLSKVKILPDFRFESVGYILTCPNLKKLNVSQFWFEDETVFTFIKTNNLDYSDIRFPLNCFIQFENCDTIHPSVFSKYPTSSVNFNCVSNPYVTDFSYYGNSKISRLNITPHKKFKNMSNLFSIGNMIDYFVCEIFNSHNGDVYSQEEANVINDIMHDYITTINKHEYVMDFTLAMSDAGFEDEL